MPALVLCSFALGPALRAAEAIEHVHVPTPTERAQRFFDLFVPFQTEDAALSPDGRHLAYSLREGDTLHVVVIEIDQPATARAKVAVATDRTSTPALVANSRELTPAQIRWMGWVTPTRLVVETNRNFVQAPGGEGAWENCAGMIIAFDADGANAKELVTPRDVTRTSFVPLVSTDRPPLTLALTEPEPETAPAAADEEEPADAAPAPPDVPQITSTMRSPHVFDYCANDPECVLVRAGTSRQFGIYRLNVVTGKLVDLHDEPGESYLAPLLDRQGLWRAAVPDSLVVRFPHRWRYMPPTGAFRRWKDINAIVTSGDREPAFDVSPDNFFGERDVPLGFADDPTLLYFASNVGRDTFGIFNLDLRTGQRGTLRMENPGLDLYDAATGDLPDLDAMVARGGRGPRSGTLLFDRFTRQLAGVRFSHVLATTAWLRPELQAVQRQLEQSLPGRSIEIREWNESLTRFLVLVRSAAEPGAFHVFDTESGRLAEFASRAPPLRDSGAQQTLEFSVEVAPGRRISGLLTVPRHARVKPLPMIVLCPAAPWERISPEYQPAIQALAAMGGVVVQLNLPGAWGFGRAHRESLIAGGYEEAQISGIVATVDHLAQAFQVNPERVALLGAGHGGFVALRALQLHPGRFRCAITIDPLIDLAGWLAEQRWDTRAAGPALTRRFLGDEARLKEAPLLRHPEKITKPVFVASFRGPPGQPTRAAFNTARTFASAVRTPETPVEFVELEEDFMRGLPRAQAEVFRRIEEFLNLTIYDYEVQLGPEKVVE